MNHFSKWGLLQLGTVKYRTKLNGHVKSHFKISILPAVKQKRETITILVCFSPECYYFVNINKPDARDTAASLLFKQMMTRHALFRRSWCDGRDGRAGRGTGKEYEVLPREFVK